MEEKENYNYYLEVDEDGTIWAVTEYGLDEFGDVVYSCWEVTATIEINNEIYFCNL